MSSNATTNETSNVTSLPSTPKAQTAKEVIAANVTRSNDAIFVGHRGMSVVPRNPGQQPGDPRQCKVAEDLMVAYRHARPYLFE